MAPGLGLYLNELLFTKYNRNVIYENNITRRNYEKKRSKLDKGANKNSNKDTNTAIPAVDNCNTAITAVDNCDTVSLNKDVVINNNEDGDMHQSKKPRVEESIDKAIDNTSIASTTSNTATIGLGNAGDEEEDEIAYNETLDWLNKPALAPEFESFKKSIIWNHIFSEEYQHGEFLQYLYYNSFLCPRDYQIK